MADDDRQKERQRRLMQLLAPIHEQARLTARRLCRSHHDGDDLFQEAALRALQRLDDLREASRFRAWFYAVLLSVHRERSRRSFWRRFLPFLSFSDERDRREAAARATPSYEETRGEATRLQAALAKLPAKQREAVVLFEVDGYSLEEVAELQADSLSAVKSRLARGRQLLRQHYEALEAVEDRCAAPAEPLLQPRPPKEAPHG